MSKYTADEVERIALCNVDDGWTFEKASAMLEEFARRLRQEEAEAKRDPVIEPRIGDRMIMPCGWEWAFIPHNTKASACSESVWREEMERFPGATIIRRRETP